MFILWFLFMPHRHPVSKFGGPWVTLLVDKLQWKEEILGIVLNFRSGYMYAIQLACSEAKQSSLKLKNWPEHLLSYLPIYITLPSLLHRLCGHNTCCSIGLYRKCQLFLNVEPRNTNWGGRLSTVDLLIKVVCFTKKCK